MARTEFITEEEWEQIRAALASRLHDAESIVSDGFDDDVGDEDREWVKKQVVDLKALLKKVTESSIIRRVRVTPGIADVGVSAS